MKKLILADIKKKYLFGAAMVFLTLLQVLLAGGFGIAKNGEGRSSVLPGRR